jgi:uncharacterized membrane protein|tara:strand:+ start:603 stop:830 length:228 start_codon:yes stop_codon:yes gene_type:complete
MVIVILIAVAIIVAYWLFLRWGKKLRKELMKEARELGKETYKKARSSKDDEEYSHPTEHDESDDLEMVKAIKEKE